ncbi:MAG: heavy-metal-associated domain-containing protein [Phycisphaerales bacterium]|nr:heavy-metal-associated domain-containing protein [Phycisphaerales bacterium]
MRLACILVVSIWLVSGCASPDRRSSTPAAVSDPTAAANSSATLTVHGLACPLCAHNIDKQLLRVEGVRTVDVDLGTGTVKLNFESGKQPSDKELAAAVEAGGFTLNKVERH